MKTTDEEAIDVLIHRFFAVFDNTEHAVPDALALIDMFADKAVIARHAEGRCDLYSPSEFAEPRIALLRSGELVNFHEWEESSSTRIAGDIAMRVSRYSKRGQLRGEDYRGRGTKFFQLARISGDWRIVSLAWTDDIENHAIGEAS